MIGLLSQIEAFILTLLLGIIAGLLIHYYQLTIRELKIGKYALYTMDLILWMIMLVLIFVGILLINQGEVRIYVFIGLVLGGLIYLRWIMPRIRGFIHRTAIQTAHGADRFSLGLKKPWHSLKNKILKLRQKKQNPPPSQD